MNYTKSGASFLTSQYKSVPFPAPCLLSTVVVSSATSILVFILNTEWVTTTSVLKLISLPSYQIDGWIISCRSNTRSSECIMTRTISTKSPFSSCGCDTVSAEPSPAANDVAVIYQPSPVTLRYFQFQQYQLYLKQLQNQ